MSTADFVVSWPSGGVNFCLQLVIVGCGLNYQRTSTRMARTTNSDEDAGHGDEIHRDFFFLLSWRFSFDNYIINDLSDF